MYEELKAALAEWDTEAFLTVIREGLSRGISASGIAKGDLRFLSKEIFERFRKTEIIFPEFLLMSDAIQAGFQLVMPLVQSEIKGNNGKKIVLGVVEGDVHDIGKNIVKVTLELEGFEVIDLGREVPVRRFVEAALESGARIIGSSSLMTPTLTKMQDLEKELKRCGLKGKIKTVVGGEATSQAFADRIGADLWGREAVEGVEQIKKLLSKFDGGEDDGI